MSRGSGQREAGYFGWLRVGLLTAVAATAAFGQNVPFMRPGSYEIGPFVGASYGIVDAQYIVGGNLTYAINRVVLPYVEYSYFPEVARPLTPSQVPSNATQVRANRNISFSDFHGGVHLRIPIHEKPIVPYLAFGVGALTHFDAKVRYSYVNAFGQQSQTDEITSPGGAAFAVNGGGGLRFYFGQRWGMRVEAKVYKPTGDFNSTFGKVEVGLFYQMR